MDVSPAPKGTAEPQGQVVQGGGQLPGVRGVGQARNSWQAWPGRQNILQQIPYNLHKWKAFIILLGAFGEYNS